MDLRTNYMGLALRNPLIASASPSTGDLGQLRALEDRGAAAVVLPSIFEEQILAERRELDLRTQVPATGFAEAQSYFPEFEDDGYGFGTERYLDLVRRAKAALDIPVIASLNGMTRTGWADYARGLQDAGADAVELNVYFIPADLALTGAEVEQRYLDILRTVKAAVSVPVAIKLGPYFSAMGGMARALVEAGADALVLFNRFYQPDIDVRTLRLSLDLQLSTPAEIRLPLLWIAILHGRVSASLAASTGVETADDAIKYLLAGADVVMNHLRAAAPRRRPHGRAAAGTGDLVGRAGAGLGGCHPRPDEPAQPARPDHLRARQLHLDAAGLSYPAAAVRRRASPPRDPGASQRRRILWACRLPVG